LSLESLKSITVFWTVLAWFPFGPPSSLGTAPTEGVPSWESVGEAWGWVCGGRCLCGGGVSNSSSSGGGWPSSGTYRPPPTVAYTNRTKSSSTLKGTIGSPPGGPAWCLPLPTHSSKNRELCLGVSSFGQCNDHPRNKKQPVVLAISKKSHFQ